MTILSAMPAANPAETRLLRVLVVENHPDTLIGITRFLEMMGHTVHSACTRTEALDLLGRRSYDVLLSDIGLPDGTGWDVLQGAGTRRPPHAIAMSGYGADADRARSKAVGFGHHLTKPFSPEELEGLLTNAARELPVTQPGGTAPAS